MTETKQIACALGSMLGWLIAAPEAQSAADHPIVLHAARLL
jgi:hypothetical protein